MNPIRIFEQSGPELFQALYKMETVMGYHFKDRHFEMIQLTAMRDVDRYRVICVMRAETSDAANEWDNFVRSLPNGLLPMPPADPFSVQLDLQMPT